MKGLLLLVFIVIVGLISLYADKVQMFILWVDKKWDEFYKKHIKI